MSVPEMQEAFYADRAMAHTLSTGHTSESGKNFWICTKGCTARGYAAPACAGGVRRLMKIAK